MRIFGLGLTASLLLATSAAAQTDPTAFAKSAEVKAMIASMAHDIKPTEEMLYRPLLTQSPYTVAIEYWVKPKQAASHLKEAEFVTVLEGSGTLVSGGTLKNAHHWYDETDGGEIVDGTTRTLKPGDTFFVPEGTPHWFGITGGKLVMLTMHVPRPLPAH